MYSVFIYLPKYLHYTFIHIYKIYYYYYLVRIRKPRAYIKDIQAPSYVHVFIKRIPEHYGTYNFLYNVDDLFILFENNYLWLHAMFWDEIVKKKIN